MTASKPKGAPRKRSSYGAFITDKQLEKQGIVLDYFEFGFKVTIARAGGANKKFHKVREAKAQKVHRQIENKLLSNEAAEDILRQVYAESVILDWAVLVDEDKDEWKTGTMENIEGELVPCNPENVLALLRDLPELWKDIKEQAESVSLFRKAEMEEQGKN